MWTQNDRLNLNGGEDCVYIAKVTDSKGKENVHQKTVFSETPQTSKCHEILTEPNISLSNPKI